MLLHLLKSRAKALELHYCSNCILIQIILIFTEVLWFENYNLTDVVTPVDVDKLKDILVNCGYNRQKIDYLCDRFRNGFDLGYEGLEQNVARTAPNLKLRVGSKTELWNKVMTEVKAGRYAGPFKNKPPFEHFIQSPIGLVPKDKGKKTRLIFHLSYQRTGN